MLARLRQFLLVVATIFQLTCTLVGGMTLGLMATTQTGCTPQQLQTALTTLQKVTQGAQYLGTALDVAETGTRLYFDRHPNVESERKVRQRLHEARLAQQALDAALAAADGAASGDLQTARTEALRAYNAVRDLLMQLQIPQAVPPAGGSETDAPVPKPFELPDSAHMEAALQA